MRIRLIMTRVPVTTRSPSRTSVSAPAAAQPAATAAPALHAAATSSVPQSIAFDYQQFDDATDLSGLAGADLVVTRPQVDEPRSAGAATKLGALAYRYVQLYWAPAGESYDGIDLAQTPAWDFCASGTTGTLGGSTRQHPLVLIDLNERAAWDYAISFFQTVKSWGYDGIMLDRGFAATVSGTAQDGTRIWNKQSTCTTDPVAPGARFADRYVAPRPRRGNWASRSCSIREGLRTTCVTACARTPPTRAATSR